MGESETSSEGGSSWLRLCPSFNAYLLAEEKERGEDPKDVAAVDALLTGEALMC